MKTCAWRPSIRALVCFFCLNKWNQTNALSGRAIRHKNDWASLILIDSRYSTPRVRKKLPAWITQDIIIAEKFGKAIRTLALFYKGKSEAVNFYNIWKMCLDQINYSHLHLYNSLRATWTSKKDLEGSTFGGGQSPLWVLVGRSKEIGSSNRKLQDFGASNLKPTVLVLQALHSCL